MWLKDDEVKMIFDWTYDQKTLDWLDPWRREKLLWSIENLKWKWLLDWQEEIWFWEALSKIMERLWFTENENWLYSWSLWELNFWNLPEEIISKLREVLNTWMREVWKTESKWEETNKYFSETWFWNLKTSSTPWCAAFVNWVLKESWLEWTWSNAAKSFIKWSWFGHVWFKVWDKMLGWNQWDKVCLNPLNLNKIAWWVLPTDVKNWEPIYRRWDPLFNVNNIPDWAIIVYYRSTKKASDKKYS